MKFSLIICTYQRPKSLLRLLNSVTAQSRYPNQILIIDGSLNKESCEIITPGRFRNIEYYLVEKENRGLTNQRNFGVKKIASSSEIVCFLDDDVVLQEDYFEQLIKTYQIHPDALGVGGYVIDEVEWRELNNYDNALPSEFAIDGYARKDSSRFLLRRKLGLIGKDFPTFMPKEGHGRSIGFIPPSGKIYRVETFMGGISSFRIQVFKRIRFSSFFEGYGLYEDTDFTLRCSRIGNLYVNTSAKLHHLHDEEGRPNQFRYGKMVLRNGWYVWRLKNPKPQVRHFLKWHLISWVLIFIRLANIINSQYKKSAFTESMGRIYGWATLLVKKPKIEPNDP